MTRPSAQDQLLYCDRCGISFLWTAEEQMQVQTPSPTGQSPRHSPPSLCAGCRALLPAPGRERGLVKWYNHRKRFGFIVRQHQPELFMHGSDVQGKAKPRPGDLVEFSVEEGERGPIATEIHILTHGEAPAA